RSTPDLEAQLAAIDKLGPNIPGAKADAAARKKLVQAKIEPYFTHSLGHGVGLAVHEEPRLSYIATEPLLPGNIVTVEPGVYFPGSGGIRIEAMALISNSGVTILSTLPKDLDSQVI
ncbi:MAG: M24 family metallopeptidase, partial [Parabacteroides sp.]|nr:M24 family metallopeptidase [Parabacteroides sp.]